MLNKFIQFNEDLEEGDKLARFFNVLESFNHSIPLPYETRRNIEGISAVVVILFLLLEVQFWKSQWRFFHKLLKYHLEACF